uniref:L-dopachrome isomerase n=1 Tax=Candidatus Kentrum sp. DK TaxID=2126562 RepID=A0A450T4Q7_9GAMM|nr:MAG: Phenylpyruvate tautomerase PptA, 4-oxalocrotonate tautomerase family [Candidatus Kentron sp. DK]
MPYLNIQTNVTVDAAREKAILTGISTTAAEKMGKPVRYVMATMETGRAMVLGGDDSPLAFVDLKGIGLTESGAAELSRTLCQSLSSELGIPPDRVYIVFSDIPRAMWGWNNGTF